MTSPKRGQVITFYSYKGGTGRSMALANVACLLAQREDNSRVLAIDWDLEAPGLHRFFDPILLDSDYKRGDWTDEHPGLINFFRELRRATRGLPSDLEVNETDGQLLDVLNRVSIQDFILRTRLPHLDFLRAGKFDEKYSGDVNTFRWDRLHKRSPWLLMFVANSLASQYEYVLIDSRTGITDISGVCTTLMPEKLVIVFTPNQQSLQGGLQLIRQATSYRRQSDDLRPLLVYPLPSRVETSEPERRTYWRYGNSEQNIEGYQPAFERLFKEVYDLAHCSLENYFEKIQLQHVPRYSYGEDIAVLTERTKDRLSLQTSYEVFTDRLISSVTPWESTEFYPCFVSYARGDAEFAKRLTSDLQSRGVRCWLTPEDIKVGDKVDNLRPSVDSVLLKARKMILILSRNSKSPWVQHEVDVALQKERTDSDLVLIPIRLDESVASSSDVPWAAELYRMRQIADFSDWKNPSSYEKALNHLLQSLIAKTL